MSSVDLRTHIYAPQCRIAGQPFQMFRLHAGLDSPIVYLSLTPLHVGDILIRVTLFQAFLALGSARLTTRAGERVAGSVTTHVNSYDIVDIRKEKLPGLYSLIDLAFSIDELRTLCDEMGIDDDDLPGTTKQRKASELVNYCHRHDCSEELAARVIAARPNWIDLVVFSLYKGINNHSRNTKTTE